MEHGKQNGVHIHYTDDAGNATSFAAVPGELRELIVFAFELCESVVSQARVLNDADRSHITRLLQLLQALVKHTGGETAPGQPDTGL